jgi:nitrite reductase (NADH) large subunit
LFRVPTVKALILDMQEETKPILVRECERHRDVIDSSALLPAASTLRHIVVGGGPAGIRAAQELARLSDRPVLIFSDERWGPYNRVKLTPLLAREVNLGQVCQPLDLETADRVERIDGCRIVTIDRERRLVRDHLDREWHYDKLILATGSRPHRPPIPGIALSGVYTFRSLNDAQALVARAQRSRRTVVIGGGLLGLEAARGMFSRGVPTTIIEHESRLMARQLDQRGGDLLRREIEALGMDVHTGVAVRQIVGKLRVEALFLSNGEEIACDTVILCTGVRPNRELALDAGLAVGRGIKVDDRMRTTDPDIFAVGECAEHAGIVDGLVAPGLEQARVAATAVTGGDALYARGPVTTRLKVVGAPVFSAGDIEQLDQRTDVRSVIHAAPDGGRYQRLVIRNGRLAAAIAVGEWDEIGQIQQLVAREGRLWPWQLRRFARTGTLLGEAIPDSVMAWPAAATVCNCTGVTRGQLGQAIGGGCATVEGLARATSASTVCGSCRPLLVELLGADAPPEPVRAWRPVALLSMLALLGAILFAALRPVPMAVNFSTDFTPDRLFLDGTLKQATGFGLLGLSAVAVILSLRKRWKRLSLGDFAGWRLVHVAVGTLALATLIAHTGFRLGTNLNFALIACFLATLLAGAASGGIIALEHRLAAIPALRSRRIDPRKLSLWLHILACWPLPLLLILHIATVYFY